jgi:NAD(P)-dependent dehydrogenase (short-subunit alcohol dehydrogenase family)
MANVLITGANRGIGLELSRQLSERGDDVIALCRTSSAELSSVCARVLEGVEITSEDALRSAADTLEGTEIDVLINNAGIFTNERFDDLDFGEIERNFAINALGPVRVTHAFRRHLRPPAKVVLITSRMGSIGDNTSGDYYGYRMAKAALNMAGVNLSHDLRGTASVAILHPGMVATRMTGFSGISTEESATGLLARIDEMTPETSGTFWHANGEPLPW